ncbi:MAG TPA: hypothetical protein VM598_13675 [Bdellovibrionota bacterium]|nr:hypothetical protein [Bdellovibrionota bacterium]
MRLLVLFAGFLCATQPALAEDSARNPSLDIGGRVYADYYLPLRDTGTNPIPFAGTSLWLQGAPQLNEKSWAKWVLQGNAFETTPAGSRLEVRVREAYVGYSSSGFELRAGRQIVPWGKSDVVNPTDLLSAKDYTIFNPDEEVRRTGQTSILVNFTPQAGNSPVTLTGVFTPVFAQSTLLFNPALAPAGITVGATPVTPPATFANTEQALKAAYAGSGWDASVLYFRGFNHMPEFFRSGTASVGLTFNRIHAAGADFSFTSGKYTFRGESAYVWTRNDDGTNPTIQPTHWDSVVGVERPFGEDFRLQIQGVWRYHPHWTAPDQAGGADPVSIAFNRQIAAVNALILNYQEKSRPGATMRFSYLDSSNGFDAELFLLGNFVGGDYLLRPKAAYAWTDAFRTTLGIEWYSGPEGRTLGQLRVYNSVFTEAKYSF